MRNLTLMKMVWSATAIVDRDGKEFANSDGVR
jgi:hypothetical protein